MEQRMTALSLLDLVHVREGKTPADALADAFRNDIDVPLRAHHEVPVPGGNAGTLLLMPAWQVGSVHCGDRSRLHSGRRQKHHHNQRVELLV